MDHTMAGSMRVPWDTFRRLRRVELILSGVAGNPRATPTVEFALNQLEPGEMLSVDRALVARLDGRFFVLEHRRTPVAVGTAKMAADRVCGKREDGSGRVFRLASVPGFDQMVIVKE